MKKTKFWVQAAVIGGVYAVLTVVLAPISYGPMQIRISELLTVLPYFTPAAIPGLFAGCLVSNMLSPYGIIDLVCGSLASLVAALGSYALRRWPILVPLPPVISNGAIVGAMLYYAYGVNIGLLACMLWVALGELIACYILGYPFLKYMQRHRRVFNLNEEQ